MLCCTVFDELSLKYACILQNVAASCANVGENYIAIFETIFPLTRESNRRRSTDPMKHAFHVVRGGKVWSTSITSSISARNYNDN